MTTTAAGLGTDATATAATGELAAGDAATTGRRPAMVSVVIPCRNVVTWIDDQLAALRDQDVQEEFEIVLSDNGSTDGLAEHVAPWAATFGDRLRVVDSSAVPGVAHARNAGCRAARGDLLLVCDADDVAEPQWVRRMVEAAATSDVVGGTMRTDALNPEIPRHWRSLPPPGYLPIGAGYLPYAQGCNTGVWREVFDRLDGWDESYVGGADDVEFSWRAQLAGFSIAPAADAVVQYRLRTSMKQAMRQSYGYSLNDGRLFTDFAGVPRRSLRGAVAVPVEILVRAPGALADPRRRGLWLSMVGAFAGRVVSTVRYRRWVL
jgi:glycosyltransferase involved in cell wall biosynthesis